MTEAPRKQRGRPRDPLIEEAILRAARRRLAVDGYSRMTVGAIAADAGVTRPTVYRRWENKHDLVVDALDHAFRALQEAAPPVDLERLTAREAVTEAVRRLDVREPDRTGIMLVGHVMAEAEHNPELLEMVRTHAVLPRRRLLLDTLRTLQERGDLRTDVDLEAVADMCIGSYYAAFIRGGEDGELPTRVVDTLWPAIAAEPGEPANRDRAAS
ncbi:TetR/AcrR family transcriptional regulator [Actinoallomurus rhizosphaericola]|uniref:TetR/AcrR family transcriptional regulator n=1 Tax=Actinoallomurus rhizosphaericola TaxID=2952536 RepID=UPI0020923C33|nr:TetR/AcrR family transcriptional regulator [Actinoallomurus rhizosphaericola]MCO5995505.1 TetR/AcrR family transcriptional regulator [Actinoallomurus rhizosphaericola]